MSLTLVDVDHELVPDKNYGSCSACGWAMSGTVPEVIAGHARHVAHTDSGGILSCIFCQVEGTVFMHGTNHGEAMGYARGDGVCMAMYLTRNHVKWAARQPTDSRIRNLPEMIARARQVWVRDSAWLDEYDALLRPIAVPEHAGAILTEELALW